MVSEDRGTVIELTESDVPGAHLSEPFASHTVPDLGGGFYAGGSPFQRPGKSKTISQGK